MKSRKRNFSVNVKKEHKVTSLFIFLTGCFVMRFFRQPENVEDKTQIKTNLKLVASLPKRFIIAGSSAAIADLLTFPFDTVKVRLQVQGESPTGVRYRGLFGTMSTIVKQEGLMGLYHGASPGLIKQMTYASIRLGSYEPIKHRLDKWQGISGNPSQLDIVTKILAASLSGTCGVLIGQPTDVVKVKIQAKRWIGGGPTFQDILMEYYNIYEKSGIRGMWKGAIPNIFRGLIEVITYDVTKEYLLKYDSWNDNIYIHFWGAFTAGCVTTCFAAPVDVVKTRILRDPLGLYSSTFNCVIRMLKYEGVTAFYKGVIPLGVRITTWNIIMWVTYEQLCQKFFIQIEEPIALTNDVKKI